MELIRFPSRKSQSAQQQEKVCRVLIESLDALYSTAHRITGRSEIAEELVQETARKALEGAASLHHEQNLRAWLFRILLNTVRDRLRRKRLWIENEMEAEYEDLSISAFSVATAIDVQNALSALPPPARTVILLLDVEEFTVLEAASILRVPPGTICSRLARARSKLREQLSMYRGHVAEKGGRP